MPSHISIQTHVKILWYEYYICIALTVECKRLMDRNDVIPLKKIERLSIDISEREESKCNIIQKKPTSVCKKPIYQIQVLYRIKQIRHNGMLDSSLGDCMLYMCLCVNQCGDIEN